IEKRDVQVDDIRSPGPQTQAGQTQQRCRQQQQQQP
ncbi:hypothetical protein Pmani_032869, partial [Petrolisthes manimaculis]